MMHTERRSSAANPRRSHFLRAPIRTLVLACAAGILAAVSLPGCHAQYDGETRILNPRTTATPPDAVVAAAYMDIVSAQGDRLTGASMPAAERVEIHESRLQDGVARMRPLQDVDLAPGQRFAFEPGGVHFMIIGLKQPLVADARIPFTLHFERAGEMPIELVVTAAGAAPHSHDSLHSPGNGHASEHAPGNGHSH
jgi:copper(I)-binding protein